MSGASAPAREAPVTAASPVQVLEPWIAARLHPLTDPGLESRASTSFFDLNPELSPAAVEPLAAAAVLVALVERPQGLSVILTRRADTLRRHSGQIALPGGRLEPGETPWDAALREAHEEVGLEPRFVRLAGLGDGYRTGTGFEVTPVVGFVTPGFRLQSHAAEVADIFETPFAFLMDRANHQLRRHDSEQGERRFYAMPYEDRLIWGVTAAILRALSERLFADPAQGLPRLA